MAVLGGSGTWTVDHGDAAFRRAQWGSCGVLASSLLLKLG